MLHQLVLLVAFVLGQNPHQAGHQSTVMGFDQNLTAHHFLLYKDGGAIDIAVKDAANTKDRDGIRAHLPHIAKMFSEGNFDVPMLVHETGNVPGVKALAAAKGKVRYTYAETPKGGRVDIVTTDAGALAALHEFLRYQIREHHTGDSTAIIKRGQ